jgi:hypothetical protein
MSATNTMQNRVADATPNSINRKIARKTEQSVAYYAAHPLEIEARLSALEKEWDVERTLIANAATLSGIGLLLSVFVKRPWLILSAVVLSFLLQHALQGWCPPLPIFRALGIRTKEEILLEWYALRALRGDFTALCAPPKLDPQQRARQILGALEKP